MYRSATNITLTAFVFIVLIHVGSCSGGTCGNDTNGRYERWIKTLVERYPDPLGKDDSVLQWWPLRDSLEYKYRITKSKWDFGRGWLNKEFTLRIVHDKENENKLHFDVQSFDEFPYKGLIIRQNRIFILDKHSEQPFIVFPLFKHTLFADVEYECRFLKEAVVKTSEHNFYAPLHTEFWQVTQADGNRFRLEQLAPRGLYYVFEKNVGIVEWFIPGGYTIELIDAQSP